MKILRKPSYLGTAAQVLELKTLAQSEGSYAERHRAARAAIGRSLIGRPVYLVPIGGKQHIVSHEDVSALPSDIRPAMSGILSACDDAGVIAIEAD